MTRPKKWIIGNWKMQGSFAENASLFAALKARLPSASASSSVGIALCVPFPYLAQAQAALQDSRIEWGAQDISAEQRGAFTGEVAASMVAEFGATFTIIGHSERRLYHHESDEIVAKKALRALDAQLIPIVCIGETRDERDAALTHTVVGRQLQIVLDQLSIAQTANIIVAYEPVWAIGATQSASGQEAQTVHAFLRSQLAAKSPVAAQIPILYGGSVKQTNASALFAEQDIDGGLIGSASLDKEAFVEICEAAESLSLLSREIS